MFNWLFKKFENRQKYGEQTSEARSTKYEYENWYFTFAGNSQNPKEFWNWYNFP